MAKTLTRKKAKTILREGEVRGRKLTKAQRGFFGARAGGAPVRRKKKLPLRDAEWLLEGRLLRPHGG